MLEPFLCSHKAGLAQALRCWPAGGCWFVRQEVSTSLLLPVALSARIFSDGSEQDGRLIVTIKAVPDPSRYQYHTPGRTCIRFHISFITCFSPATSKPPALVFKHWK